MQTFIKYALSFFKSDWKLEDYPIRIRYNGEKSPLRGSQPPIPWAAQIVNWWTMVGFGQTKEEAFEDLRRRFNEHKSQHGKLLRPGTKQHIEFAPTIEIERYEQIATDFFEKILDMDYHQCFVSDESSLWDFQTEETDASYHRKINEVYGVDISDIESGELVQIFQRIAEKG